MKHYKTILSFLLILAAFTFTGCNTVKVDIPAGAEITGSVTIETNQATWKSNAVSGEAADGRVDAVTSPKTDTSLTGL